MTRLAALAFTALLALGAPQTEGVSVVLLIDTTKSVTEAMASFIWDGAGGPGGLESVRPSGVKPPDSPRALFLQPIVDGIGRRLVAPDRVRLGIIAKSVRISPIFTNDRAALRDTAADLLEVPNEDRHGPSPLWDGIDAGIDALADESGRRAIVLVTDGLSTGNRRSLSFVIQRATAAKVTVSVVAEAWRLRSGRGWSLRDSTDAPWVLMQRPGDRGIHDDLRRLTSETGGVLVVDGATGWPKLGEALAHVYGQLHQPSRPTE